VVVVVAVGLGLQSECFRQKAAVIFGQLGAHLSIQECGETRHRRFVPSGRNANASETLQQFWPLCLKAGRIQHPSYYGLYSSIPSESKIGG